MIMAKILHCGTNFSLGILTKVLTARPLVLISRISYQIFLAQFPVLFYFAATSRSGESFNLWSCVCVQIDTKYIS